MVDPHPSIAGTRAQTGSHLVRVLGLSRRLPPSIGVTADELVAN